MKRINITCPVCGSKAYLRPASVVYGDKAPDPDAKYYVCGRYPACDCYVAAHRKTLLPMGTLADKALRKKRHDAHVALDSLWKNGVMSRKEAYRLLQLSMGLPAEDAHIAKFSAARCDEVIALSRRFRAAADKAAYAKLLELVCDEWELAGFHRATYEYQAEKLRQIADKLQCGIGYDYDAAVRKCQKLRGKKPRNDDVGEDAMVLAVKRGFEQAQAKANKPSSPSQNDDKEVNRYE